MTKLTSSVLSVIGLSVLTACGGGGGNSNNDAFQALVAKTSALGDSSEIAATNIPTQGSVTYSGTALLLFENDTDSPLQDTLIGDATADVNFTTDTFTGTATDFYGANTTINEEAGTLTRNSDAEEYSGTLNLTNGLITGTDRDDFTADLDGTLIGDGNTIIVDTSATNGFIYGPEAEGLDAEFDNVANLNGNETTPEILFQVERDPTP